MKQKILPQVPTYDNVHAKSDLELIKKERQKIAENLHDGVCPNLAATILILSTANERIKNNNKEAAELVNECIQLLRDTLIMTRDFTHDLILPNHDCNNNLTESIQAMVNKMNMIGKINYKLHILGQKRTIPEETSVNVYRIIQEFINNSQKYSNASIIDITLHYYEHLLQLSIYDDGKGFDVNEMKNQKTMGLANIANRVAKLKGEYFYKSSKGQGVKLQLSVPIGAC